MTQLLTISLASTHINPSLSLCSSLMHLLSVPPANQARSHLRAFAHAVLSAWKLSPELPMSVSFSSLKSSPLRCFS